MATKRKTRVSATTKTHLNDLRKERAKRQAEMSAQRTETLKAAMQAIKDRAEAAGTIDEARQQSRRSRATAQVKRSAIDAIRMGAQSRRITDDDGRPVEVQVDFSIAGDTTTLRGWNNGKRLYVGMGQHLFEVATKLDGYRFADQKLVDIVMDSLVGVGYHEIGHSIHSPNYEKLLTHAYSRDAWAASHGTGAMWKNGLNALDDQRMETAMVLWSPNLARSLTSVVTLVVAPNNTWAAENLTELDPDRFALMHGRFYLPTEMQQSARDDFEAAYGAARTQDVADAIDAYLVARNFDEMADALIAFMKATSEPPANPNDPDAPGIPSGFDGGNDLEDQPDDAGADADQIAADGDAIADAAGDMKSGTFQDQHQTDKVSSQAESMADQFRGQMAGNNLGQMFQPTEKMHEYDLSKADALGRDIAQRLRTAAAGNSLRWVERSRQGVVNGFQYRTRTQRSDMHFFRQEQGTNSLGFDLDVTVLLDVSISMGSQMEKLSIVGHAIKLACDEIGAHCNVGLFAEEYVTLYSEDSTATGLALSTNGGTEPRMAFEDVENHRSNARHVKPQLVIVLTDGQFSRHISPYEEDNQHWIGIGLEGGGFTADQLQQMLLGNGFEEIRTIQDPIEVASVLENWLHDTVVTHS